MKFNEKNIKAKNSNIEIKKQNEGNRDNNIDLIYNRKITIKVIKKYLKLLILIFSIIYILYPLFLYKEKKSKFRKLESRPSEIIITLNTTGTQQFINNLNPLPNQIIINGTEVTVIESKGNLLYNFEYGDTIIIVRWYNAQLTNCYYMFGNLRYIKKIDLSNFDSSKVTNTRHMFFQCQNLIELNLNNFKTSLIEDMYGMFSGCNAMTSFNLSHFVTSKVKDMEDLFAYDFELLSIDLSSFDTSLVTSMKHMFMHCVKLTSLNLSGFNTTSVKGVNAMFKSCEQLTSINLLNFDTSNIENFNNLFNGCENLENILQNFDTSKCTDMNGMFSGCKKLISLDISNFNMANVIKMNNMFENCDNLESLNFNQLINLNQVNDISFLFFGCKKLKYLDLSFLKTSNVLNMGYMFYNCENLKYLNILNFDSSSATNITHLFDGCKSLKYLNMYNYIENNDLNVNDIFNDINENLICCINNTLNARKLISLLNEKNIKNDCSNECFYKNILYTPEEDQCIVQCYKDDEYKYKYNNKCYKSCDNYYSYDKKECIDEIPEGYYLNSSLLKTIDKCPIKCKSCSNKSMENNLCISCNNNYKEINKDLFNDCIIDCPEGYIIFNDLCQKTYNIINCDDNNDYELVSNHSCIDKCISINFLRNICKAKNNTLKIKTNITNNIREDIKNGTLNSFLENVTNNEKIDIEVFESNIIYQITSTFNQNNKLYNNISIIKLKECENRLKTYYQLDENKSFIILKIDNYEEGLLMPIVEYEVYHPDNFQKIDLDICENITIEISLPVSIDEDELYKYNSSSDYYNDKCYPYTSENGTDVILSDRQLDYVYNNLSICESNCKLEKYDNTTKYASCNCEIKNEINIIKDITIDKDKLFNSFIDIKSMMNLEVLKCYYVLFKKDGLLTNIGSYILLCTIFIFIICLIFFILKGYNFLINQINNIIKKKKEKSNKISYNQNATKNRKLIIKNRNKKKNNNRNKTCMTEKNILMSSKSIKEIKRKQKKNTNIPPKKLKNSKRNKRIINSISNTQFDLNEKTKNIKLTKSILKTNKININKNIKIKFNLNKEENKEIKENNNNIILKLNDSEMNSLKYMEALKYDKRSYFKYYLSLLRTKHIFILAFYPNNNDYNSQSIKICLFFFSFVLYYAINALFFTDDTIHQIHESEGQLDFIYQIPQILYSTIISSIINALIKYFSLSEKNILAIKNEKDIVNNKGSISKTINCLKIKFICFFILSFIFLISFWYYLSCFCAVYKNTQWYLIEDTLISFCLSLLYPFGLNLIPGIFRIPSLNDPNQNKECMYKFSKIIQ